MSHFDDILEAENIVHIMTALCLKILMTGHSGPHVVNVVAVVVSGPKVVVVGGPKGIVVGRPVVVVRIRNRRVVGVDTVRLFDWTEIWHLLSFVMRVHVHIQAGSLGETGRTNLALVGLLSCMQPLVISEGFLCVESLPAPLTDFGLLACVRPFVFNDDVASMSLKITVPALVLLNLKFVF